MRGHPHHGRGVGLHHEVAVPRLDEDGRLGVVVEGEVVGAAVLQLYAPSDVFPRVFHRAVPVDVGQQPQAYPVVRAARIREAVHRDDPR